MIENLREKSPRAPGKNLDGRTSERRINPEPGVYILPYMSPNGTGRKLTYWSNKEGNKTEKKKLRKVGKIRQIWKVLFFLERISA